MAMWLAFACFGSDAENSSLKESRIENAENAVTATSLLEQNAELRRQLSIAQESVSTLTDSLAESNAQAELFRRKYSDLELRAEALGLASVSKDRAKLEQRLLAAVSDLRLAEKERDEYRDQLSRLRETMLRYLKTSQSIDAQARLELETELRNTGQLTMRSTSASTNAEPSLMDGTVLNVKEEWSFVVGNLGASHGMKIGMPVRVMRGDQRIATLRVVDVRQRICGAVIQEMDLKKEKIRVGDRFQVDARSDVSAR